MCNEIRYWHSLAVGGLYRVDVFVDVVCNLFSLLILPNLAREHNLTNNEAHETGVSESATRRSQRRVDDWSVLVAPPSFACRGTVLWDG